jgi:conjugal transfer pilus assembly protein TraV
MVEGSQVVTRSVIRLPACPVSDYRPHARAKRIAALATTASLGLLASCTTLGTNISGKFACGAPEGGSLSAAADCGAESSKAGPRH